MQRVGERTEVDALVPKVCVGVVNSLPTLTERALARALEAAPVCTTGRPGDIDDLLGGIRRIVEVALPCIADDRLLDRAELSSVAMFGGQRARLGMARTAFAPLLHAVREELLDALHHEAAALDAGAGTGVHVSRVTARRVGELGRQVQRAVLVAYDRAAIEVMPREPAEEAALVDMVLGRRAADESVVREAAERMGRRLGPLVGPVLLLGQEGDDHTSLRKRAASFPHPTRHLLRGPVAWTPVLHLPLLVSCASPTEWATLVAEVDAWSVQATVTTVVVKPGTDLEQAADAYVRVQDRLRWVPATTVDRGTVDSRRLDLLALLGGSPDTTNDGDRFVHDVLGPVLDRADAAELVELIDATYRCTGGAAVVARLVHRHRNTVRKQMARIESLLGLSLDRPADRHLIDTALALRRMRDTGSATTAVRVAR